MRIRLFVLTMSLGIMVVGLGSTTSLLAAPKINNPVKKAQIEQDIKFWEAEYLEAVVRRYDVRHKTGDFADIDPSIYGEFEHLVESDFQNTEDQLARARSEYNRYQ